VVGGRIIASRDQGRLDQHPHSVLKSNFVMPSLWTAERLRVPRRFEGCCPALLRLEFEVAGSESD
jgi:hypothetical protein